jgi:hypothetical protein
LRDLLKSSLTIWKGFTDKIASQLKESVAIKTAVTESGDAVRAQGLELYCVELQQRLKDMKEERTEQFIEAKTSLRSRYADVANVSVRSIVSRFPTSTLPIADDRVWKSGWLPSPRHAIRRNPTKRKCASIGRKQVCWPAERRRQGARPRRVEGRGRRDVRR